jgi:hypothetical protein
MLSPHNPKAIHIQYEQPAIVGIDLFGAVLIFTSNDNKKIGLKPFKTLYL